MEETRGNWRKQQGAKSEKKRETSKVWEHFKEKKR